MNPIATFIRVELLDNSGNTIAARDDVSLVRFREEWVLPDQAAVTVFTTGDVALILARFEDGTIRTVPVSAGYHVEEGHEVTVDFALPVDFRPGFTVEDPKTWSAEEHAVARYVSDALR